VAIGLVTLAWIPYYPLDGSPPDAGLSGPASLALYAVAALAPAALTHLGRHRPHAGAWSMGVMVGAPAGALAGMTVWYGLWRDSGRYGPFDVGMVMVIALLLTLVIGLPLALVVHIVDRRRAGRSAA